MSEPLAGAVMTTFLAPACHVLASTRAIEKDTGTFDDDVDAHFLPRQVERVTVGDNLMTSPSTEMVCVINDLDIALKRTQDGIVLEQVRAAWRRRIGSRTRLGAGSPDRGTSSIAQSYDLRTRTHTHSSVTLSRSNILTRPSLSPRAPTRAKNPTRPTRVTRRVD